MNIIPSSISLRLLMFVILPTVISLGVLALWVQSALEAELKQRMEQEVQLVARALQMPVNHAIERGRPGSVGSALVAAERIGRVFSADIYDASGRLVASTHRDADSLGGQRVSELEHAQEGLSAYRFVGEREVYSYFVPLGTARGKPWGFLQVTRLHSETEEIVSRMRRVGLLLMFLALLVVTIGVTVGYQGAIGRALGRLERTIEALKSGDRSKRAEISGPREVANLSRSFNEMLEAMQTAAAELDARRQRELDLQQELRRVERLASLGRLAGGIAHEFGTPLSIVGGTAQRLLRRDDIPADVLESVRAIEAEGRRMESITREFLQFGRTGGGRATPVPISVLVATVQKRAEVEHATVIAVEPPDEEDVEVCVDFGRIERALLNLISNAQHAGELTRIVIESDGDWVLIHVDDDGPGIPPELHASVLEPFFTTKPANEGTGLGLPIVHSVAEEHHGVVLIGDSPNLTGARVTLKLPRYRQPTDQSPTTGTK